MGLCSVRFAFSIFVAEGRIHIVHGASQPVSLPAHAVYTSSDESGQAV